MTAILITDHSLPTNYSLLLLTPFTHYSVTYAISRMYLFLNLKSEVFLVFIEHAKSKHIIAEDTSPTSRGSSPALSAPLPLTYA